MTLPFVLGDGAPLRSPTPQPASVRVRANWTPPALAGGPPIAQWAVHQGSDGPECQAGRRTRRTWRAGGRLTPLGGEDGPVCLQCGV